MERFKRFLILLIFVLNSLQIQINLSSQQNIVNQTNSSIQINKQITRNEENEDPRIRRRTKSSNLLPNFPIPIGNVTAVLGRDVRLICTVDNLGSYQGFYQCQVNTNPMRSTSGYLEVVVPPTIVKSQTSQVVEIREHSNVNLQCKANGQPKPTIVWRRDDGSPIKLSGSPQSTGNDSELNATSVSSNNNIISQLNEVKSDKLTLFQVDRSMAGIYVCSASNGIPTDAIKRIPLYVKFPPKTSVQTKLISVNMGQQLQVDCLIEGFPKPNSFWSKATTKQPAKQLNQVERDFVSRWYSTTQTTQTSLPSKHHIEHNFQSSSAIDQHNQDDDFLESLSVDSNDHNDYKRQSLKAPGQSSNFPGHPHNRIQFKRETQSASSSEAPQTSASVHSDNNSSVSVKQTALNPYTYRLQLSFSKIQLEHLGKYSCIASNQMGQSEANTVIIRADGGNKEKNQQNSDYRSVDEQEYERSSQQQDNSSQQLRRANGNRVIYDENYLQAIKSRQNNFSNNSRSQQRLKLKAKNASQNTRPGYSFVIKLIGSYMALGLIHLVCL